MIRHLWTAAVAQRCEERQTLFEVRPASYGPASQATIMEVASWTLDKRAQDNGPEIRGFRVTNAPSTNTSFKEVLVGNTMHFLTARLLRTFDDDWKLLHPLLQDFMVSAAKACDIAPRSNRRANIHGWKMSNILSSALTQNAANDVRFARQQTRQQRHFGPGLCSLDSPWGYDDHVTTCTSALL